MSYQKVRPTNKPMAIAQLVILPLSVVVSLISAFVFGFVCFLFTTAENLQDSYDGYREVILKSFGYEKEKPF